MSHESESVHFYVFVLTIIWQKVAKWSLCVCQCSLCRSPKLIVIIQRSWRVRAIVVTRWLWHRLVTIDQRRRVWHYLSLRLWLIWGILSSLWLNDSWCCRFSSSWVINAEPSILWEVSKLGLLNHRECITASWWHEYMPQIESSTEVGII